MNASDERMHAYFDGELPADEAAQRRAALEGDVAARAALDRILDVDRALEELGPCEPSAGFTERVLAACRVDGALDALEPHEARADFTPRTVARVRAARRRGFLLRLAVPAAAAAAVLVAVMLGSGDGPVHPAAQQPSVSAYRWEADTETFDSLDPFDLEGAILEELGAT
jgi:anti-sigma factor RsiW